jgi:hypothetical protein
MEEITVLYLFLLFKQSLNFFMKEVTVLLGQTELPDSCLAYSSAMKMEATCSPKTVVNYHLSTRCYIPKDITLHDLKSYITSGYRVFIEQFCSYLGC